VNQSLIFSIEFFYQTILQREQRGHIENHSATEMYNNYFQKVSEAHGIDPKDKKFTIFQSSMKRKYTYSRFLCNDPNLGWRH
jgi:hypothetical protein